MNNRIYEPNKTNYGESAFDKGVTVTAFTSPVSKNQIKVTLDG